MCLVIFGISLDFFLCSRESHGDSITIFIFTVWKFVCHYARIITHVQNVVWSHLKSLNNNNGYSNKMTDELLSWTDQLSFT